MKHMSNFCTRIGIWAIFFLLSCLISSLANIQQATIFFALDVGLDIIFTLALLLAVAFARIFHRQGAAISKLCLYQALHSFIFIIVDIMAAWFGYYFLNADFFVAYELIILGQVLYSTKQSTIF
jgi:hypothetical protein